MYENDYIMRMIRDLCRTLSKLLTNTNTPTYELPLEGEYTESDFLYKRILELLNEGKINQAENELLESINYHDSSYANLALFFYSTLNEYDDDYLEAHNYSREEVEQGLNNLSNNLGIPTL